MPANNDKSLIRQRNEEALRKADGESLNVDITITPSGEILFNWYSPAVHKLIMKVNPEQGEKMLDENHLCG